MPDLSPQKLAALARARAARSIARERRCPDGYRSLDHFLDAVRERVGSRLGATVALAHYLGVNEASVRRWLKRQKFPLQPTIDALATWMLTHR